MSPTPFCGGVNLWNSRLPLSPLRTKQQNGLGSGSDFWGRKQQSRARPHAVNIKQVDTSPGQSYVGTVKSFNEGRAPTLAARRARHGSAESSPDSARLIESRAAGSPEQGSKGAGGAGGAEVRGVRRRGVDRCWTFVVVFFSFFSVFFCFVFFFALFPGDLCRWRVAICGGPLA